MIYAQEGAIKRFICSNPNSSLDQSKFRSKHIIFAMTCRTRLCSGSRQKK